MATTIYYFTGTGNSFKVAKDLAQGIPDAIIKLISKRMDIETTIQDKNTPSSSLDEVGFICEDHAVGFVFPLYYFGLPKVVEEFIRQIDLSSASYIFAVCTYGKMAGGALTQVNKILEVKGKSLNAGYYVHMVDNFILSTWDVQSIKKQNYLHLQANVKADLIAKSIRKRITHLDNRVLETIGPSLFGYKSFVEHVTTSDRKFWVAYTCNSCRICTKVCSFNNIIMEEGRPHWKSENCQQCLACLHFCPQKAIQYGKRTMKKKRYQNPEISINDF